MSNRKLILPYRVVDERWHTSGDFQILFASGELNEAIAVARDSGGGATVVFADGEENEPAIFIAGYAHDLSLPN